MDLTDDIAAADEAIKDAGRLVRFRALEPGASPAYFETSAVFIDYTPYERGRSETIAPNDQKMLVSGLFQINGNDLDNETTPNEFEVYDGSSRYEIVSVSPFKPGEQMVIYEIQVRR